MLNHALTQQYQNLLDNENINGPITVLHIGHHQIDLFYDIKNQQTFTLPFGIQTLVEQYFYQDNITPLSIENAIVVIEDQIMTLPYKQFAHSSLFTFDKHIQNIAKLAGVVESETMILKIDQLECCFNRFADVISGYPATLEGLPTDAVFAATLLILREWMHHVQFNQITIKTL